MENLPKSTKTFIVLSVLTVGSIAIGLIGGAIQDSDNGVVPVSDVLEDSVVTKDKDIMDGIMKIEDEDDRMDSLHEAVSMAKRSVSVQDENTVIGENIFRTMEVDETEDILYISFDKYMDNVDLTRENIIAYANEENSYPVRIIYTNVESSNLSGREYYRVKKGIPYDKQFAIPYTFLVVNGEIVWEDFTHEKLPFRGDIDV